MSDISSPSSLAVPRSSIFAHELLLVTLTWNKRLSLEPHYPYTKHSFCRGGISPQKALMSLLPFQESGRAKKLPSQQIYQVHTGSLPHCVFNQSSQAG